MSYWDNALMAQDIDLRSRIVACSAQEVDVPQPDVWAIEHMLTITSAPGWADAWASALAGGNELPGRDEGVITDGMILSEVQAVAAAPEGTPA